MLDEKHRTCIDTVKTETNAVEMRREVLRNISRYGLLPIKILKALRIPYLPSQDIRGEIGQETINGNLLPPHANAGEIAELLYPGSNASMRVVSERKRDADKDVSFEELSQRCMSSFLVLFDLKAIWKDDEYVHMADDFVSGYGTFSGVRPEFFTHLLFPEELTADFEQVPFHPSTQLIPVKGRVQRFLWTGRDYLAEVPNYETTLWKMAHEFTVPHLIHGVRLPIAADARSYRGSIRKT